MATPIELELAAWQDAEARAQDACTGEHKRLIMLGVDLDMARSEAAFWKRLAVCTIMCVVSCFLCWKIAILLMR